MTYPAKQAALIKCLTNPDVIGGVNKTVTVYLNSLLGDIVRMNNTMLDFHSTIRDIQQSLQRTILDLYERNPHDRTDTPES